MNSHLRAADRGVERRVDLSDLTTIPEATVVRTDDGLVIDLTTTASSVRLLEVRAAPRVIRPSSSQMFVTRTFDILVASAGLVVLAPLMILIAVAVKITSPGPAIFGSPRIGRQGNEFKAWKFRSMLTDAEDRLLEVLDSDASARQEYDKYRKLKEDPRLTPIGSFIRVSSLDELPQLVNILLGQMSVVGPRPKLLNERLIYGERLPQVLSVKPGLTGLWQVSGRNNLTLEDRVVLDLEYARDRSLVGDLAICARTVMQLCRPSKHGAC